MAIIILLFFIVFWVVMPYIHIGRYYHFGATFYIHLHGWRWRQHAPLKWWYPLTRLQWYYNPEDHNLNNKIMEALIIMTSTMILNFSLPAFTAFIGNFKCAKTRNTPETVILPSHFLKQHLCLGYLTQDFPLYLFR
jgi:hypothetical protein